MGKTIIKILIDQLIPIIELICQLSNDFFFFSFIRIPHIRFSIFFKSVDKFLERHHSIESRCFTLNTNPNLVRLLFMDLFSYSLVNLWSNFEIFGMLRKSWTPKEYRVTIPSTYIAFFVMNLSPFMSIYNFLHSQVPCEAIVIISIKFFLWLDQILLELNFMSDWVSVESQILDFIRLETLSKIKMAWIENSTFLVFIVI